MKKLHCLLLGLLVVALTASAEEGKVTVDFSNAPIVDMLRYYATLTGEQVIFDNTVQG